MFMYFHFRFVRVFVCVCTFFCRLENSTNLFSNSKNEGEKKEEQRLYACRITSTKIQCSEKEEEENYKVAAPASAAAMYECGEKTELVTILKNFFPGLQ